jgi:hypothetical protein
VPGYGFTLVDLLGISSLLFLVIEAISFMGSAKFFFENLWMTPSFIDVLIIFCSVIFLYMYFKKPTGLSINDRKTATAASYFRRALQGEYKDNPLFSLFITVLAMIIASLIMKLLGWI